MAPPAPPEAGASGPSILSGLIQACPELQLATRIVVGFSGGVDSTVLLHLLHRAHVQGELAAPVHALHINHAMQSTADEWQHHCHKVCTNLGVPIQSVRVPVIPVAGNSLEETARNVRHGVFESVLQAGEIVALAQHGDDQVETVLFRLLRGSGPAGLAGMPRSRPCGKGLLLRPLLDASRADVQAFARASNLAWIEDGSNDDQRFDRNFLRSAVLPQLSRRWPGLAGTVQRSARLAGEAAELLDELAAIDLVTAAGPHPGQLRIDSLMSLTEARQRNVLRYWLHNLHVAKRYAAPTHQVLQRIVLEVLPAGPDAEPLLSWGYGETAVELRRHRHMLHVFAPLPAVPEPLIWQTRQAMVLPEPLGTLQLHPGEGPGLPMDRITELKVGFRSGGELVKPAGRPTRPLKKILQEEGIPPWLRERIPLLYVKDELVAVADLLICDGWLSDKPGNSCRVVWRHPDLDCGYQPHLLI